MKYTGYTLSFQEVPGETSIAISISNCPFRCSGCHSAYLQTDVGYPLTSEVLLQLLSKYQSPHTGAYTITCVVFFGGEQHHEEFIELANFANSLNLRVCLYTGAELLDMHPEILSVCQYIKTGPYVSSMGGLTNRTTNQRMYDLHTHTDITHKFWEN